MIGVRNKEIVIYSDGCGLWLQCLVDVIVMVMVMVVVVVVVVAVVEEVVVEEVVMVLLHTYKSSYSQY